MIARRGRIRFRNRAYRSRRIVGQETNADLVAEQRLRTGASCRRRGAQHKRDRGIAGPQRTHQRSRRGHFAERHRVQPNARRSVGEESPSEALAQIRPVAAVAQSPDTALWRKPKAPGERSVGCRGGARRVYPRNHGRSRRLIARETHSHGASIARLRRRIGRAANRATPSRASGATGSNFAMSTHLDSARGRDRNRSR